MHTGAERGGRAQRHPAGLPELQCAVGIAVHEHALDRDHVGPMLAHQRADASVDTLQPHDHLPAGDVDAATGHVTLAAGSGSR